MAFEGEEYCKSNLRNSGFDFAKKRGKEAAVINQLESYLILKIKALGHWVASHDEYYSSQVCPCCFGIVEKVPNYHLRVHECQTCKRHFHRDTGSAQLMARIVWSLLDRTWSDDEANPVPPIMRRWQPPTALKDQPAQIASSSSEPQAQTSVKRKEREEVNPTTTRSTRTKHQNNSSNIQEHNICSKLLNSYV
jgi:hypothetical protein